VLTNTGAARGFVVLGVTSLMSPFFFAVLHVYRIRPGTGKGENTATKICVIISGKTLFPRDGGKINP